MARTYLFPVFRCSRSNGIFFAAELWNRSSAAAAKRWRVLLPFNLRRYGQGNYSPLPCCYRAPANGEAAFILRLGRPFVSVAYVSLGMPHPGSGVQVKRPWTRQPATRQFISGAPGLLHAYKQTRPRRLSLLAFLPPSFVT
jgi:hypothetical protein